MEEKYTFVKDWVQPEGTINAGNVLTVTHGCIYFNGGLMPQVHQKLFGTLIATEKKNGFNYLKPEKLIYNKC